jgi:hypothetical protein
MFNSHTDADAHMRERSYTRSHAHTHISHQTVAIYTIILTYSHYYGRALATFLHYSVYAVRQVKET